MKKKSLLKTASNIAISLALILPAGRLAAENLCVPGDFLTIQQAVDSAVSGDSIIIAPGEYRGAGNRDIRISASQDLVIISSGGAEATILDCEARGRGLIFENCKPATQIIDGFTIVNGLTEEDGGAVRIENSSPLFIGCAIENSIAEKSGGGVYGVNSEAQFIDCRIANNISNAGDDNQGGGGMAFINSAPYLENCEISGNESVGIPGVEKYGGGGGIFLLSKGEGLAVISNCSITMNRATNWTGGGITAAHCSFYLKNSEILHNTGSRNGHVPSLDTGGGITLYNSSPLIKNCVIEENIAYNAGGIDVSCNSSPIIVNSIISRNTADTDGGGLRISENSNPIIAHCTIVGNIAGEEGGYGGGIRINSDCSPKIINTIIWDNKRVGVSDQIYSTSDDVSITYTCVENGWAGRGNINLDPLFTGEHQLQTGSPCIDSAINLKEIVEDLYGNPRPDIAGGRADMGAEEFNKSNTITDPIIVTGAMIDS